MVRAVDLALGFALLGLGGNAAQTEDCAVLDGQAARWTIREWEANPACLRSRQDLAVRVLRRAFESRQFDDWERVRSWPELGSRVIPRVKFESDRPGRQVLIPQGDTWVVSRAEPPTTGLIVLFHPLCSPSQRALRALAGDPRLDEAFFVGPVDGNFSIEPWRQWQEDHPRWKPYVAFRKADWPEVAEWATPTFIVVVGGSVVHTVVGWPPEGNWEAWKAGVSKLPTPEHRSASGSR